MDLFAFLALYSDFHPNKHISNKILFLVSRCDDSVCRCVGLTFNTFKQQDKNNNKMTSAVCDDIYNPQQQVAEPDSDAEDDPGKLLNVWLGQLNKVRDLDRFTA